MAAVMGLFGPALIGRPGDSATVLLQGTTTPATLYTDSSGGTTAQNPTALDSMGRLSFYAAAGFYDVAFDGGSVTVHVPAPTGTYAADNPVIASVVLDAQGRLSSWTENGVAHAQTYDAKDRVATYTVGGVARTFTYDANDNVIGAV